MNEKEDLSRTGTSLRVLFVEDNPRDVKLMAAVLQRSRYRLTFDTVDSLASLQEQLIGADHEIIICDYNLGDWTAIDALEVINKSGIDIPVVVVSGSLGDDAVAQVMKQGAIDYVLKDRLARLPSAIERALKEKALREERKRTVEALRASEEKYRRLLEAAPDAILTVNSEGFIALVNEQAEKLFGYSRDELLGRSVETLVPEHLRDSHAAHRRTYSDAPHMRPRPMSRHLNLYGRRKDGTEFPVEISLSPMETPEGWVVTSIITDITERRAAEDALRRSEEKYRRIIDTATEGIWIHDTQAKLLFANQRLAEMLGFMGEELSQLSLYDLIYETDLADVERRHASLRQGRAAKFDVRLRRKDGTELWVIASSAPLFDDKGEYIGSLGMLTDITDRKQLEGHSFHAQKMEAIGRLAGGVAHDFNNMVGIILGHCQLLMEPLNRLDPRRRNLEEIEMAGKRAAALTRQLLAFSRKQVIEPRVLDFNAVVTDVAGMLRRLVGEDIDLKMFLERDLSRVKVDPVQIEQVLMNLAVNARDAMRHGGQLTIETANIILDESYTHEHRFVPPGPYVMLAVSDTGCGMDGETQAHIFEPFFTTKEQGKGTGLGLATVYGIVKQSGGHIWVYSEPGQGTTFKVYFPRVQEILAETAPIETAGEPLQSTETVLLVEDESPLRRLVSEFLRGNGYSILEAGDGEEALEIAARHQGHISLLITDVIMPKMNGRMLAERLEELHPDLKVLYVSGYTDETIARHGVLEPGIPFLQKPFNLQELARKARQTLDAEKSNVRAETGSKLAIPETAK